MNMKTQANMLNVIKVGFVAATFLTGVAVVLDMAVGYYTQALLCMFTLGLITDVAVSVLVKPRVYLPVPVVDWVG